jgi:cytochrome c oxidase subunit 3
MNQQNQDAAGGRIGMWLFISTEILLFGGLFILYSMYRLKFAADFHSGSMELSRLFGTINTCFLITSSFTVALAVHSNRRGERTQACIFLAATLCFAAGFLIVKAFEWAAKFEHGLYPNAHVLLSLPRGENLYFGLYYLMTGLHAVHVLVGIGVLSVILARVRSGSITRKRPIYLENAGLYWHLVDVIWIFLFPLFYLIT